MNWLNFITKFFHKGSYESHIHRHSKDIDHEISMNVVIIKLSTTLSCTVCINSLHNEYNYYTQLVMMN